MPTILSTTLLLMKYDYYFVSNFVSDTKAIIIQPEGRGRTPPPGMARPYRVSSLWRLYPDQSRIWNRDAYLDNVFLYNVHWVRQAFILCLNFTYLLSPLRSLWIIGLLQSLSIPLCVALCFFFASFQVFPIFSSSFNLVFFPTVQ